MAHSLIWNARKHLLSPLCVLLELISKWTNSKIYPSAGNSGCGWGLRRSITISLPFCLLSISLRSSIFFSISMRHFWYLRYLSMWLRLFSKNSYSGQNLINFVWSKAPNSVRLKLTTLHCKKEVGVSRIELNCLWTGCGWQRHRDIAKVCFFLPLKAPTGTEDSHVSPTSLILHLMAPKISKKAIGLNALCQLDIKIPKFVWTLQ